MFGCSLEGPTSRSQVEEMAAAGLWVFGYGSLCWHQGFDFSESMTGFVVGFSRRFWQGNVTHRGTDHKVSCDSDVCCVATVNKKKEM